MEPHCCHRFPAANGETDRRKLKPATFVGVTAAGKSAGRRSENRDIVGIHEHDAALIVDPSVTIFEAVDGRVELVVTADRGHHQLAWLQMILRQGMDREARLPDLVGKCPWRGWLGR